MIKPDISMTKAYLEALYEPTDIVQNNGAHPSHVQYCGPASGLQNPVEYIGLNPLHSIVRTKASAVDIIRPSNFLIEFDSVSIQHQKMLLQALDSVVPVRTMTASGGKSTHAVISVSDTLFTAKDAETQAFLFREYAQNFIKAAVAYLTPMVTESFSGKLIDEGNVDASRLNRLAGAVNRQWKDPSKPHELQELLSIGRLCTSAQFDAFIAGHCPPPPQKSILPKTKKYQHSFARTLRNNTDLHGLEWSLVNPLNWGGAAGNHPTIYRLTHWAAEQTGVSEQEFKEYIREHTAPQLIALGYEMWKIDEAIEGAYKIRQSRGER